MCQKYRYNLLPFLAAAGAAAAGPAEAATAPPPAGIVASLS